MRARAKQSEIQASLIRPKSARSLSDCGKCVVVPRKPGALRNSSAPLLTTTFFRGKRVLHAPTLDWLRRRRGATPHRREAQSRNSRNALATRRTYSALCCGMRAPLLPLRRFIGINIALAQPLAHFFPSALECNFVIATPREFCLRPIVPHTCARSFDTGSSVLDVFFSISADVNLGERLERGRGMILF